MTTTLHRFAASRVVHNPASEKAGKVSFEQGREAANEIFDVMSPLTFTNRWNYPLFPLLPGSGAIEELNMDPVSVMGTAATNQAGTAIPFT